MAARRVAGRPSAYKPFSRRKTSIVKRVSSQDVEKILAAKVKKLERSMRARKPEEKFFDAVLSFLNVVDTTGAVQHLTAIAAGSDYNNRIGDTIRVHRIAGHFRVATGSGSLGAKPTGEEFISSSIIQDTQQAADTSPTASGVFVDVSPPGILTNEALVHHRYKILSTSPLLEAARLAPLSVPVAADSNQAPTQSPVWYFDFPVSIRTSYNGTATSDIERNGIYMVVRSSLTADTLDCDGRCRIFYTDC